VDLSPVTLEGAHVRLEPLSLEHLSGLVEAAREWGFTPARVQEDVEAALRDQAMGTALPFATVHQPTGRVAGGTRFRDASPQHRRVEIGSTWLGGEWRRTGVNTEAKLLMLEHAFGALGCGRVEFRADLGNLASRRALSRIGAVEEGTLRHYVIDAAGEARDIVVYSIIEPEWPVVRERLRALLRA
jgi:RimJ/RimL family protein N-acetyltransferase